MCVLSMVMDHFGPKIPSWPTPNPPNFVFPIAPAAPMDLTGGFVIISREEADRLRALIADFRAAVEAAKAVDRLTAQPDCVDPEKAKLEERVAELEKRLSAIAGIAAAP